MLGRVFGPVVCFGFEVLEADLASFRWDFGQHMVDYFDGFWVLLALYEDPGPDILDGDREFGEVAFGDFDHWAQG